VRFHLSTCVSLQLLIQPPFHADVLSLQDPNRGSFAGDEWGEQASRFTYCAVSILSLLGRLDDLDKEKTVKFIEGCRNFDGGFGMVEGAESHAAYGALSLLSLFSLLRYADINLRHR
jgi:geranylgeranyl transferase type-2 subunit beta